MNGSTIYRRLSNNYSNRILSSLYNKPGSFNYLYRLNKRFIQLPPYHPKYKKPELVYDLNLDWRRYRGLYWLIPVPPKARPACYVFAAFIFLEYFAFVICHHMMLRD